MSQREKPQNRGRKKVLILTPPIQFPKVQVITNGEAGLDWPHKVECRQASPDARKLILFASLALRRINGRALFLTEAFYYWKYPVSGSLRPMMEANAFLRDNATGRTGRDIGRTRCVCAKKWIRLGMKNPQLEKVLILTPSSDTFHVKHWNRITSGGDRIGRKETANELRPVRQL